MDAETTQREPPPPAAYRSLAAQQADAAATAGGGAWKRVAGFGAAALGLGALGFLGWSLFAPKDTPPQRVVVTQVTRVSLPPPPPPPPPPKVDPPPDPAPRVQDTPAPQPKPEAKPPPPQARPAAPPGPPAGLGLPTGPGSANPYGIGAGGDGYVVGGTGSGGGGGDAQRYFHQQATQRVAEALKRDERTRGSNGAVAVTYDDGGRIVRVRLLRSTGDASRDRAIIEILTGLSVARPPPGNRTLNIEISENV